jgi:hypothetical protein
MDPSGNSKLISNTIFRKNESSRLLNTKNIEVNNKISKYLSIAVILLIFITLIIGITSLSRSATSFNKVQEQTLGGEQFKTMEHLTVDNTDKQIKNLQTQIGTLTSDIKVLQKTPVSPIYKMTNNKVIAPANRTSGTYYALGPMISKKFSKSLLTAPPLTDTGASPTLQLSNGFISPNQTWAYEIDGTIRTAYNKTVDKMGSCIQVVKNNNNITMTENAQDCTKWTWNAKGQFQQVQSGQNIGKQKCLTAGTLANSEQSILVDNCNNDPSQAWSFFAAPSTI